METTQFPTQRIILYGLKPFSPVEVYGLFKQNCCFHHPDTYNIKKVKVKGKVRPKIGNEGPKRELYSSTFVLSSALDVDGRSTPRPWALENRERDPVPLVQGAG